MKNTNYVEGRYYSGFGTYLGTRITHTMSKKQKKEHIFSTGIYDIGGAMKLNRLLVNAKKDG